MNRTYKRKLILTKAQEKRLKSWIGASRVVYNLGLEISIDTYKKLQKSVHRYTLEKQMSDLRKGYDWIGDVPYDALQSTMERLSNAYNTFFRKIKSGGGFPKFASKKTFC